MEGLQLRKTCFFGRILASKLRSGSHVENCSSCSPTATSRAECTEVQRANATRPPDHYHGVWCRPRRRPTSPMSRGEDMLARGPPRSRPSRTTEGSPAPVLRGRERGSGTRALRPCCRLHGRRLARECHEPTSGPLWTEMLVCDKMLSAQCSMVAGKPGPRDTRVFRFSILLAATCGS